MKNILTFLSSIINTLPIYFYYLLESLFLSIFIYFGWKFILKSIFEIEISYIQWVTIIWIFKVIFFDVFKTITFNDKNTN